MQISRCIQINREPNEQAKTCARVHMNMQTQRAAHIELARVVCVCVCAENVLQFRVGALAHCYAKWNPTTGKDVPGTFGGCPRFC